jgi:hypothetical protein
MKLTKTQLREIIKEEISKLKQPKMSTRLKELINKGWVLNEVDGYVKNPVTGRQIKITTALGYSRSHPAYKAAEKFSKGSKMQRQVTPDTDTTAPERSSDVPKMSPDKAKSFLKDFDSTGLRSFKSNLSSSKSGDLDPLFNDVRYAETPKDKLKAINNLVDSAENWKEDPFERDSPRVLPDEDIETLRKMRDEYTTAVSSLKTESKIKSKNNLK